MLDWLRWTRRSVVCMLTVEAKLSNLKADNLALHRRMDQLMLHLIPGYTAEADPNSPD